MRWDCRETGLLPNWSDCFGTVPFLGTRGAKIKESGLIMQ